MERDPICISDPTDHISRKEFDEVVKRLKSNKTTRPDDIPVEARKYCPVFQDELLNFLNIIWTHERLPVNLVQSEFKMLFKGKQTLYSWVYGIWDTIEYLSEWNTK